MDGLSCVTPTSDVLAGRGVARGICTAGCDTDADCAPWQLFFLLVPVCADIQGTKICLEFCPSARSSPSSTSVIAVKTWVARRSTAGRCSWGSRKEDAHRSAARMLNVAAAIAPSAGTVSRRADPGDPVGSSCDPEADAPPCAGFCDTGQDVRGGAGGQTNTATCSELCVVGGPVGCGWSGKGVPHSACETPVRGAEHPSLGLGDMSRCAELCNCDADCSAKTSVCEPGGGSYGALAPACRRRWPRTTSPIAP